MPFGATLIAYAPGGLEAMVVLALGRGIDPLFVSAQALFALGWKPARLRLVGEPALTRRYARAAALFDLASETGPEDATIRGFRRLAALTEGHA